MAIDTELKARLDDMQAQLDKLFQLHGLPTWKRQQKQKRMAGTSTRNHQSVQATMRISDSSDSRIHCSHESRFYKSGY
jgi:hypothetical protein